MNSLHGKTALVTGANGHLGGAIALRLAKEGANVAVACHHNKAAAEELAAKLKRGGVKALAVQADASNEKEVARMVRTIEQRLGGGDVLVNCVGGLTRKPLAKMVRHEFQAVLDSNLFSAMICSKACLPGMRRRKFGRIVNFGHRRVEALAASRTAAAYHVAKTGLLLVTRAMAVEEAPHGITVNMVSPGGLFDSSPRADKKEIPRKRFGKAEDVANAIAFLAHPDSDFVTGENVFVTGGYKLHGG